MKTPQISTRPANLRVGFVLALGLCLLATPFAAQAARNLNPGVVPAQASFRGLTYGEWSAKWWQAAFALPVVNDDHILFSGGAFGGDDGVVFLAAVGGGATIDVTIPTGAALFFPVLNWECSVLEPDPFHGDDEASLRACANGFAGNATGLAASIDGVSVANVEGYRSESPLFEFVLPEDNLFAYFGFDAPAGTTSDSVDAGFYLLLRPLPPGTHTVTVAGTSPELESSIDTTFHITVVPEDE
jgi:hypothetical protein